MNNCLNTIKQTLINELNQVNQKLIDDENLLKSLEQNLDTLLAEKNKHDELMEENNKSIELKNKLTIEQLHYDNKLNILKNSNIQEKYEHLLENEKLKHNNMIDDIYHDFENQKNNISNNIKLFEENINNKNVIINSLIDEIKTLEKDIVELDDSYKIELNNLNDDIIKYDFAVKENSIAKLYNDELLKLELKNKEIIKNTEIELLRDVDELHNYNEAKTIMSFKYPTWLIDKKLKSLTKRMNNIIEYIYYKPLNVSFEINKTSVKMTYSLNNGKKISINKLSGAEKEIVDLAFTKAWNDELSLSCLILDEVDAGFDVKRKEEYISLINELSKELNQMIIITHNENLKNSINANVINL